VPFDEGALTGKINPETRFPEGDWRNSYFGGNRKEQVWERIQAITRDLGVTVDRLPEIALRFCLSQPATSTVIAGMRSLRNVDANVRASELGPLSAEELEVLRRHRWVRNFYSA
jgi:aryl-alcohol dehydrogenase-like predicted oxidoreductase